MKESQSTIGGGDQLDGHAVGAGDVIDADVMGEGD